MTYVSAWDAVDKNSSSENSQRRVSLMWVRIWSMAPYLIWIQVQKTGWLS